MALIPSLLLKQLYTFGSLQNTENGIRFSLKNRLSDARLTGVESVKINGNMIPLTAVTLDLDNGSDILPTALAQQPIDFPLRQVVTIFADGEPLPQGKHKVEIKFKTEPFGKLNLKVEDSLSEKDESRISIPRHDADDYEETIISARQKFVADFTGSKLEHVSQYSFDPHITQGNIEHFTGVA
ncbi:MAG: hydroxymethylglutaryl-CoA reductase, partial [Anaerolineae bacterium]